MMKKYLTIFTIFMISTLTSLLVSCESNPNDPENENVVQEVAADYTFPNSRTKVDIERVGEGRDYDTPIVVTLTGVRTEDSLERITSDLMQIEKGTVETTSQITMLQNILRLDYVDWDNATIEITQTIDSYNDVEGYVLEQSEESLVVIEATPKKHCFKLQIVGGSNDKTFLKHVKERNVVGTHGQAKFSEDGTKLEFIKYNTSDGLDAILYTADFDNTKSESVATYISEEYLGTTYMFEVSIKANDISYGASSRGSGIVYPKVSSIDEMSDSELEYYEALEEALYDGSSDIDELFLKACLDGHLAAIDLILEDKSFDINMTDEFGATGLMYAALISHAQIEYSGYDVDSLSNSLSNSLYSLNNGTASDSEASSMEIESIDNIDNMGDSVGENAFARNEGLDNEGALNSEINENNSVEEYRANYYDYLNVIKFLLYRGADYSAINESGWNVLMIAVDTGNYELVAMLVALDIDVNVVGNSRENSEISNIEKLTALDLANLKQNSDVESSQYDRIIALLEEAEAKTAQELA